MRNLSFGLLVSMLAMPAVAQEPRQLAPILVQSLNRIGGNYDLQSPGILLAKQSDRFSELGWSKYTQLPNDAAYTGEYINYALHVIESTQFSNNSWGVNTSILPFLNRYISGGYWEGRSDVRSRYVCVLELWGIFDINQSGGRIEIARGHGGSAAAFEFVPYQGYQTSASIYSAGHSSSGSNYVSNPLSLQEDALLKAAVTDMNKNLEADLFKKGFSFSSLPSQQPTFTRTESVGGQPSEPQLRMDPIQGYGVKTQAPTWTHIYRLKVGEKERFHGCHQVIVWGRSQKGQGEWHENEQVRSVRFFQDRVEFSRQTTEAAEEQLQFIP